MKKKKQDHQGMAAFNDPATQDHRQVLWNDINLLSWYVVTSYFKDFLHFHTFLHPDSRVVHKMMSIFLKYLKYTTRISQSHHKHSHVYLKDFFTNISQLSQI
jgi:hypothetical protein